MPKAEVALRYTLPVRSLPPGQSQRMKVSMKPPEQDPSGARGHEGLRSVRLQAAALMARLKALAHSGPVHLFLEVPSGCTPSSKAASRPCEGAGHCPAGRACRALLSCSASSCSFSLPRPGKLLAEQAQGAAVACHSFARLLQPCSHDGVQLLVGACKAVCMPWNSKEGAAAAHDQLSSCLEPLSSCVKCSLLLQWRLSCCSQPCR